MASPVSSGVLFTIDPSRVEASQSMVVEAVHGLGEGLVSGEITPHTFLLDVQNQTHVATSIPSQTDKVVALPSGGIDEGGD